MTRTAETQALLDQVDPVEAASFVRGLAAIPGETGSERAAAEYLAGWLERLGFDDVQLQDAEPGRPNVLALLDGSGDGYHLLLNGQLDVVPGDEARSGLAAMCLGAAAVKRSRARLRGRITVAGVVGALQGGVGTMQLIDSGLSPNFAVLAAPTGGRIGTFHHGWVKLLLTTKGKTAWVGAQHRRPHVNAVYQMRKVIRAFSGFRWSAPTAGPSYELPEPVAFGPILGGFTRNYYLKRPSQHADVCTVVGDLRFPNGMNVAEAVAQVEGILEGVKAVDPELEYTIELPPSSYRAPWQAQKYSVPPMLTLESHPVVTIARGHLASMLGVESSSDPTDTQPPASFYGADGGHLQAAGATCLLYGPAMSAPTTALLKAVQVLALLAADIGTRTRGELAAEPRPPGTPHQETIS